MSNVVGDQRGRRPDVPCQHKTVIGARLRPLWRANWAGGGHTVTHPVDWKGTEGGERKIESHSSSHTTSFPSLITASATHTTKSMLTHSRVIEYERSSLYISVSEELIRNGQNRR